MAEHLGGTHRRAAFTVAARVALLGLIALSGCDRVLGLQEVQVGKKNNVETCLCECDGATGVPLNKGTGASADDGQQLAGAATVTLTGSKLALGATLGKKSLVALRFPMLGITHGDPANNNPTDIQQAIIQFTGGGAFSGNVQATIRLEDDDDAPAFTASEDLATELTNSTRPTTATVNWPITTTWKLNEAGVAEQTIDFSALLQQVVDRDGWTKDSSLAVFIEGTTTTTGPTAFAYDQSAIVRPQLIVTYVEPRTAQRIHVCMTTDTNPNRDGTVNPPANDTLDNDCKGRVQSTVIALAETCGYTIMEDQPCHCSNDTTQALAYAPTCDDDCTRDDLATDCSNLDPNNNQTVATSVPNTDPVCTAEGAVAASMFTRRSECHTKGTAGLFDSDGNGANTDASGTVWIVGAPCSGTGCALGLQHQFGLKSFSVGNLFESATFSQLAAIGGSVPGGESVTPTVCTTQFQFNPNFTSNAARGHRDDNDTTEAIIAPNSDVLCLDADFTPGTATCALKGALAGSINPEQSFCEDSGPAADQLCTGNPSFCGSSATCTGDDNGDGTFVCRCLAATSKGATVSMNVTGVIVNQPPTAAAGSDQVVECKANGSAPVTLDASASSDPDGNAATFRWFRNGRTADAIIGYLPQVTVQQSVATTTPYIFRVVDVYGQAHESTTNVSVVDTTPPTIACNTPATITPSGAPISFTATASDACDPSPTVGVTGYSCFSVKNGVVTRDQCVVTTSGAKVTITNSGGVGDHIQWTVSATDHSGNQANAICSVLVVRK